jgi:hypothetical protein
MSFLLPVLDPYGKNELTCLQVEALVGELAFISQVVGDDLLASYVGRLIELAQRCVRSSQEEKLVIEGILDGLTDGIGVGPPRTPKDAVG